MAPYFDGSINGSGPGLAIDDAGFGSCACATFVDPWSGPGHAELDDACHGACQCGLLCPPRLEELLCQVRYFIHPLPQRSYHVFGNHVHHIVDAYLAFLLYQHRSRESEVDGGKDEKDFRNHVVPPHFVECVCGLDDVAG